MNREIKEKILQKIKAYDRIFLFRHIRNDGDCVGATRGFQRILQLSFPEKQILLIDDDPSEFMNFLGENDPAVPDEYYADALGIVLDTASEARISNKKYKLCKEVIKIDHHIPLESYGCLVWVEEERSACCEMIVDFYDTFRDQLKIDAQAATCLFAGMVTDSGRFKYSGINGETMRAAGVLLDVGVNTDWLYANLYLESIDYLKFKAHIYQNLQVTENGVAYIFVDKAMQERFDLTQEQASACVGKLDSIRGCICWVAFIETGDEMGSIRVRLRSRFVPVNPIAETYRGGGHAFACGATLYSREEIGALLNDADALVKEYKETHEDWL